MAWTDQTWVRQHDEVHAWRSELFCLKRQQGYFPCQLRNAVKICDMRSRLCRVAVAAFPLPSKTDDILRDMGVLQHLTFASILLS
jgi:hypothetical protein